MITVPRNKIAVRYIQDPTISPGGIHLVGTERSDQGIVKYVGKDVKDIQPGDYVVFSGWAGTTVHLEGEGGLIFLMEESVECIVHPPATEIPGLYFLDEDGKPFPATYESTIELIHMAYDELPRFANLKNRKRG